MIYVISNNDGAIKVGFTKQWSTRRRELSRICIKGMTLIHKGPGSRHVERHLHDLLADHRFHGEWFHDVPEVREVVGRFASGGANAVGYEPPAAPAPLDAFTENAVRETRALAAIIERNAHVDAKGAVDRLKAIEQRYGLPGSSLWTLRYRPKKLPPGDHRFRMRDAAADVLREAADRLIADMEHVTSIYAEQQEMFRDMNDLFDMEQRLQRALANIHKQKADATGELDDHMAKIAARKAGIK